MPQNQNQNQNPIPNSKDTNNQPTGGTHVDPAASINVPQQRNPANPVPEPVEKNKKIPGGALNKALMRTFRGDVKKNLGAGATPSQVDSFAPKKATAVHSATMTNTPAPAKTKAYI